MQCFKAAFGLLVLVLPLAASSITINSDGGVTFLDSGTVNGDFSNPFTAADFVSAQTGSSAFVQASTPFWASSLPGVPAAKWIGTNSTAASCGAGTACPGGGDTALYAVSFTVPSGFLSASLDLTFMVDNVLGFTNPGIYINGTALPSSTGIPTTTPQPSPLLTMYTDVSIGSLLTPGTNRLYINAVNLGGPGGLIFSANITTVDTSPTPEPSSLVLVPLGALALYMGRRRLFRS